LRFFALGFFILVTWYVTRLPAFTVSEVQVAGGETISHDVVRSQVEAELAGTYFLVVPRRFSYLYPHDSIVETLGKIPRVHDVVVTRTSRSTLSVSFREYVPYALWCGEGGEGESCWFVNSEGYAFAEAPSLHGGTLVRHTVEGSEVAEGTVIDAEKFARINTFIRRAEEELGLRITTLMHKENGDIELSVNGGGMIFVSGGRDFDTTFGNLKAVLSAPEFEHLEPGNFRYVDVRFENKVFVNEELVAEPATATATTAELPE
jgi:hypothetical protein